MFPKNKHIWILYIPQEHAQFKETKQDPHLHVILMG